MEMINLLDLSDGARGVLVEAIPLQAAKDVRNAKYQDCYQRFMKETDFRYVGEGSFERFQMAVIGMRRRMRTLTYKGQMFPDVMTKGTMSA